MSLYHQRIFFLSLLFILLLNGCQRQSPPQLAPLETDAIVLAFGDSLTFGTGAGQPQHSYPAVLERLIQRKVINAGIPGERSEQGLKRLPGILAHYQPQLLILCHGGNDFLQRKPITQAADNVRQMVALAQKQAIDVVLIGVPRPGLFLSAADFYAEIAQQFKIPYAGDILSDILEDSDLKSDTVHPNAQGYRQLAQTIAQLLKQAQAI